MIRKSFHLDVTLERAGFVFRDNTIPEEVVFRRSFSEGKRHPAEETRLKQSGGGWHRNSSDGLLNRKWKCCCFRTIRKTQEGGWVELPDEPRHEGMRFLLGCLLRKAKKLRRDGPGLSALPLDEFYPPCLSCTSGMG